ncbi:MAG: hypothetical protein HW414_1417, partial [Dehalococcoidia bacterium]|nr:hypothetical protein [Dehalococcoidia bacterium]
MNVKKMLAYQVVVGLVLALLMFPAVSAYAQDPQPPENPDQPWNPPERGGDAFLPPGVESKSASSYYPTPRPGTPPSIIDAYLIDEAGQTRTQFGDEPFYLVVRVNSPGQLYLAEYYPAGSGLQRHWLIYRHYLDHAGSWTLGPFYASPQEPEGQHTWKLWLNASGAWAQRLTYFSYQPAYPYP